MRNINDKFEAVTVFVLASNETESLKNTVAKIKSLRHFEDIYKIVIVVKNSDCPAFYEAEKIVEISCDIVEIYVQKSDSLEQCIGELPSLVETSHFVITAADGEMEIENIDTFISKAKVHPERIVCAAKWHKDSVVQGYGWFHTLGSRCINCFISILFNKKVKDPFSIYQIFPTSVYNRLNYKKDATFGYEYTIKALRYDIEYEEIPTFYRKRIEGKTNFSYAKLFSSAFVFCYVALKIRFKPKEDNITAKRGD